MYTPFASSALAAFAAAAAAAEMVASPIIDPSMDVADAPPAISPAPAEGNDHHDANLASCSANRMPSATFRLATLSSVPGGAGALLTMPIGVRGDRGGDRGGDLTGDRCGDAASMTETVCALESGPGERVTMWPMHLTSQNLSPPSSFVFLTKKNPKKKTGSSCFCPSPKKKTPVRVLPLPL